MQEVVGVGSKPYHIFANMPILVFADTADCQYRHYKIVLIYRHCQYTLKSLKWTRMLTWSSLRIYVICLLILNEWAPLIVYQDRKLPAATLKWNLHPQREYQFWECTDTRRLFLNFNSTFPTYGLSVKKLSLRFLIHCVLTDLASYLASILNVSFLHFTKNPRPPYFLGICCWKLLSDSDTSICTGPKRLSNHSSVNQQNGPHATKMRLLISLLSLP